jgi:hypothetical protein
VPPATENVDALRQGWIDAVNALAPEVPSVRDLLAQGLDDAERNHELSEETLLASIDAAMREGGSQIPQETGQALVRRLQRSVYEYLLSLDAAMPAEGSRWAGDERDHAEGAVLIGAEEVAALRAEPVAAVPAAEAAEAPPEQRDAPEVATPLSQPEPEETPAAEAQPAETASADETSQPVVTSDEPGRPRRFAIFGRSAGAHRAPESPEPDLEPALEPAAEPAPHPTPALEAVSEPEPGWRVVEPAEPAEPARAFPPAHNLGGDPYIAPREGFHIREDSAPLVVSTPSRPAPPASTAEPATGWRVRDEVPPSDVRSQRSEAAAAAAARTDPEEAFTSPAVVEARKRIDDRLGQRRCDEAAALVQKLSQEPGGRSVAELALDAGDRCRALGKNNSALSCYLAATRADPVFDEPLLRLADICIDDHDIDLAVAYLERVARFYRMAGDHKAALRIFRRIATIAPYREDILSLLVRMQSTGRFDD